MTAAPNSPLVERVITAMCEVEGHDPAYRPARENNRKKAQAAVAACETDVVLDVLRELVGETGFTIPAKEWEEKELLDEARALLARLEADHAV